MVGVQHQKCHGLRKRATQFVSQRHNRYCEIRYRDNAMASPKTKRVTRARLSEAIALRYLSAFARVNWVVTPAPGYDKFYFLKSILHEAPRLRVSLVAADS